MGSRKHQEPIRPNITKFSRLMKSFISQMDRTPCPLCFAQLCACSLVLDDLYSSCCEGWIAISGMSGEVAGR
uniref:Uncharacterized protein n=1 Tax=Arundo donax TaxID=35708 RepID=A0A0A8Z6S0_ARUDO